MTARLRAGTLKVLKGRCPNLLAEAGLYRWPEKESFESRREVPVDDNNHALAALRHLVSRLDHLRLGHGAVSPEARA